MFFRQIVKRNLTLGKKIYICYNIYWYLRGKSLMNTITTNTPSINSVSAGEPKNTLPLPEQIPEESKIIGADRSVAPSATRGTLVDTQI